MSLTKTSVFLQPVAAAVLLSVCSCVNEEYDFTDGINGDIDIEGEINLPIGSTEFIRIGDFLDMEENGFITTDDEGNFLMSVEGDSPVNQTIEIQPVIISGDRLVQNGGFSAEFDVKNEITSNFPVDDSTPITPDMVIDGLTVEDASTDITINEDLTDISDNVKAIREVNIDAPVEVVLSLRDGNDDLVDRGSVVLKSGLVLDFPDCINLVSRNEDICTVEEGSKVVFNNDMPVDNGLRVIELSLTGIDFSRLPEGQGYADGHLYVNELLSMTGLSLSIDAGTFGSTVGELPETAKVDIAVNVSDMRVLGIDAVIDPQISIENQTVEIGDLPEFLTGEGTRLDLYNPVLTLNVSAYADNTTDESFPEFLLNADMNAYDKDGNSTMDSPVHIGSDDPASASALTVRKGDNHFYISRRPVDLPDDGDVSAYGEYYDNIIVENLSDILNVIPDKIEISDINVDVYHEGSMETGYTDEDYIPVIFPEDGPLVYEVSMDYGMQTPLAFGENLQLSYATDFDGWNSTFNGSSDENSVSVDLREAVIYLTFVNSIPLEMNVTASPIDLDGNVMEDSSISISLDGSVAAGNIGSETSTDLQIHLSASQEALESFDGLKLNITATSGPESEGIALNENQGIKLNDIRMSIDGGVTIDMNKKK